MTSAILLVDDDASLLALYTLALEGAGYRVTAARSMEEAHAQLDASRFDVVITDILLGAENGLALLEARGAALMQDGTIIIAISSDWEFQPHVIATGVRYFMAKPVSPTALVRVIQRLLENNSRTGE